MIRRIVFLDRRVPLTIRLSTTRPTLIPTGAFMGLRHTFPNHKGQYSTIFPIMATIPTFSQVIAFVILSSLV